ncbi:MAG TPA: twin-arginine translocation signal domain-containing protein [Candidatus Limnocylindrales bacterium]|nr:twin-arginine translocation signal domain-containing protein [Candidatus Limnocylindrales bacterium]
MQSDQVSFTRGESRRQFIKKTGLATAVVAGSGLFQFPLYANENNPGISIVLDESDPVVQQPPVQWAVQHLQNALAARGVTLQLREKLELVPSSQECIFVGGPASNVVQPVLAAAAISLPDGPECLAIARGKTGQRIVLAAAGSDARGQVYALLELADRVRFADDPLVELRAVKPVSERPANAIRSVMRAFVSDVQDKPWFNDRAFWQSYLTMLATHRFNRFNLALGLGYDFTSGITDCYFHFAYPFLLSVPGYNVRAVPLPDAERDRNLEMLRFISEETKRRGLHFQLGLWTHAYRWTDSPRANYLIEGLTPESQASYCRDALRLALQACPAIRGVTIRTHGESGVPEGEYGLWRKIFDGAAQCGRRVEIDLHAKGVNEQMIDAALDTGLPVTVSPKFWAEHMGLPYMQGAIRALEMPPKDAPKTGFFALSTGSRSFMRYGYGDLLTEDRRYGVLHRIWPGTQRMLLWGDPQMAADYGRVSSFCGSQGVELFEPLAFKGRKGSGLPGGRNAYADPSLEPALDFKKFSCTYRVWGRNLYNPNGEPDGWQREWRQQFGRGAEKVEAALASASRILPLVTVAHCPSAANNNYWPELYTNIAIVAEQNSQPYSDTPSPRRLGTVSPLDPEFFSGLDEFADELIAGKFSGKYSPAWVAERLEEAADQALLRLKEAKSKVRDTKSVEFRRLATDIPIQAGLGRFFAARFRAGVLYALYQRSGHGPALKEAIKLNRVARSAWAEFAEQAKIPYLPDITYGPEFFQRGQWLDRLPAIDQDTADLEKLLGQSSADTQQLDPKVIERAMQVVFNKSQDNERPPLAELHTPPPSFQRGKPFPIVARVPKVSNLATIVGLRLCYRHVNQAEIWQSAEMEWTGEDSHAVIAADYTDSPFPLQYYFQIRTGSSKAWLYPGLEERWHGQPYYFVRQAT